MYVCGSSGAGIVIRTLMQTEVLFGHVDDLGLRSVGLHFGTAIVLLLVTLMYVYILWTIFKLV